MLSAQECKNLQINSVSFLVVSEDARCEDKASQRNSLYTLILTSRKIAWFHLSHWRAETLRTWPVGQVVSLDEVPKTQSVLTLLEVRKKPIVSTLWHSFWGTQVRRQSPWQISDIWAVNSYSWMSLRFWCFLCSITAATDNTHGMSTFITLVNDSFGLSSL